MTTMLGVKADVLQDFETVPSRLDFGTVRGDSKAPSLSFDVVPVGDKSIFVKSVESTSNLLSPRIVRQGTLTLPTTVLVEFAGNWRTHNGLFSSSIILHTDSSTHPRFKIPVQSFVAPLFKIHPSSIVVAGNEIGVVKTYLNVQASLPATVRFSGQELNSKVRLASANTEAGLQHRFAVEIMEPQDRPTNIPLRFEISIAMSDGVTLQKSFTVPVYRFFNPAPERVCP